MPDLPASREEIATPLKAISQLVAAHQGEIGGFGSMRDTVSQSPHVTTAFNQARRKALHAVDQLITEFEKSFRLTQDLYDVMQKRYDSLS
jgi:hypothetical protein